MLCVDICVAVVCCFDGCSGQVSNMQPELQVTGMRPGAVQGAELLENGAVQVTGMRLETAQVSQLQERAAVQVTDMPIGSR